MVKIVHSVDGNAFAYHFSTITYLWYGIGISQSPMHYNLALDTYSDHMVNQF